jgi:hypothetical protein
MKITTASQLLSEASLLEPSFDALIPSVDNYKVLLVQPHGEIEGSAAGVWNRNRARALSQFGGFLADAFEVQPDLVVTPEYSLPWPILIDALKDGKGPASGKLWVLGCESIKYRDLEALKAELGEVVTFLYETLDPNTDKFLDPLVYVFKTRQSSGEQSEKIVALVQFKTYPMGDDDHFELNGLQRGTTIYQFGSRQDLKLASLICSDVFDFSDDDARAIYDRSLIIHIQLNPRPRQTQYRRYRDRLLQFQGDATEIICLNWAEGVTEWSGQTSKPWHNVSLSAWYLRPDKFDRRDRTLTSNHQRGLYYTWLEAQRAHSLFLNFKPATFLLLATKVAHVGVPAAISRRRGPQLIQTSIWDDDTKAWNQQDLAEDGFSAIVGESGDAKDNIERIAKENPFAAERVLALCAGKIAGENWHDLTQLDSCLIDETETIYRITFSQDPTQSASDFRVARLKRCGNLWTILSAQANLPPALKDFEQGFRFEWVENFPHQNSVSAENKRATVVYMGEDLNDAQVEATKKKISECLRRGTPDLNESHDARQRLAVWFRRNNEVLLFEPHELVKYDNPGDVSEFDIGRE